MVLALASSVSWAEDGSAGKDADISGDWTLESAPVGAGCEMSGTVSLSPAGTPGLYRSAVSTLLVARAPCPPISAGAAKEACVARRAEATLAIGSCTVDSIEPPNDYSPDNFSLTIVDGSNMAGVLFDGRLSTIARLHRGEGPIS